MALNQSSPAGGNVSDIADARRNRGKTKADASSHASDPPGDTLAKPDKNSNRRFDKEKVERIKAEISAGKYVIDHKSVADKFIEHERNS